MERMKFTGKDWKKTNFSPNCTNFQRRNILKLKCFLTFLYVTYQAGKGYFLHKVVNY